MQAKTVSAQELERQRVYLCSVRELNSAFTRSTGRQRAALVQTYGCQQNVSDSEKIMGMLIEMGYAQASSAEEADVVIFNTCAVREHAEQRVFGNAGALKPIKARNPSMVIGLCGCMMQQEHVARRIKEHYSHVDMVFGTGALYRLPQLLYEVLSGQGRVFDLATDDLIAEGLPVRRDGGIKAFLPVSYGCNNFCTYCIVPHVRGRERSRDPEKVFAEAHELVAQGYKDITLLGQNVNSYGNDLAGGLNFSALLRRINGIEGDFRLRFMTSHPKDATQELFETIAACDKVSKHIHLPFQAGSDRILRQMNRRYTKEAYLELVGRAKAAIPGLSLTSDIIVGFPGETEEDFRQTLDVVRQVEFDNLFTFIYSKRKGTPAERMEDPVPHAEKIKWFDELLALQDAITRRKLKALEGQTLRVLCEGPGKTGEGYMTGRTDAGTIVDFEAGREAAGQFLNVRITQALKFMLLGEIMR